MAHLRRELIADSSRLIGKERDGDYCVQGRMFMVQGVREDNRFWIPDPESLILDTGSWMLDQGNLSILLGILDGAPAA